MQPESRKTCQQQQQGPPTNRAGVYIPPSTASKWQLWGGTLKGQTLFMIVMAVQPKRRSYLHKITLYNENIVNVGIHLENRNKVQFRREPRRNGIPFCLVVLIVLTFFVLFRLWGEEILYSLFLAFPFIKVKKFHDIKLFLLLAY